MLLMDLSPMRNGSKWGVAGDILKWDGCAKSISPLGRSHRGGRGRGVTLQRAAVMLASVFGVLCCVASDHVQSR